MSAQPTINAKMLACANGDEQAFRAVFDHFYPRLLTAASKVVGTREDAEELTMNVMLRTWQFRDRVAVAEQMEDYIFGILRQQIAGFMRKKVLSTAQIEDVSLQALGTVEKPDVSLKDIRESYRIAIGKLSDQQRKIFLMSREELLSHQEIAERTGLSVNTINNHVKAALKVLRYEFRQHGELMGFLLVVAPSVL